MRQVTIIGIGMVGGSLGQLIKKHLPRCQVVGTSRFRKNILRAKSSNAIDWGTNDLKEAVKEAELVILATPPSTYLAILRQIAPWLPAGCLVIDVGSTKEETVRQLSRLCPAGVIYIGGHPLAGSEKVGIKAAAASIMQGATFVLTPLQKDKKKKAFCQALNKLKKFLHSVGFNVLLLSPREHDELVAFISHLPYLLAVTLTNLTASHQKKDRLLKLAAGGWRSSTRLAASLPDWGLEVCTANQRSLLAAVSSFRRHWQKLEKNLGQPLSTSRRKTLRKSFRAAAAFREKIT